MNKYETVFILTPVLSDVQMKEAVEKFAKVVTDNGGKIVKKSTGFYALVEFEAEASVVKTLETAYRRDERVIRFLTFRLDKYAAEYAEKRRSLKSAAQPVVEQETKED